MEKICRLGLINLKIPDTNSLRPRNDIAPPNLKNHNENQSDNEHPKQDLQKERQ